VNKKRVKVYTGLYNDMSLIYKEVKGKTGICYFFGFGARQATFEMGIHGRPRLIGFP
jgi:hypothetical protein